MLTPSLSSSAWSLTERSSIKLFRQVQIPAQKYFLSSSAFRQRQSWCGWKNNSIRGRKLKLDSSFLIHNRYYLLTSNSEGCLNGACEFHSRNCLSVCFKAKDSFFNYKDTKYSYIPSHVCITVKTANLYWVLTI